MNKTAIYPSLLALAERKQDWNSEIERVAPISSGIHYDIGDGQFVPSFMLAVPDIGLIQSSLPIDVHIMVQRPSEYIPELLTFPLVSAIAFHVECIEDIHEIIQTIRNAGKKVGLAILDTTPADHLDPYLLEIDYVIVMTIKAGYSGNPFIPEMLSKIEEIHHKIPELPIVVDGGIGEKTLPLCADAGATRAVMSSALFSGKDIGWLL
jgi:ribulose-phosphate 3-epimerase